MFGEILLTRPVSLRVLTVAAATMAFGVMVLLAFGSYTRRVTTDGIVMPDSGLVKVYTQQPGTVLKKSVVEGQRVTRGMVLYTVSTELWSASGGRTQAAVIEQARQRKSSLLDEIRKTRLLHQQEHDTLGARVVSLRAELARLDDQISTQQRRVSIAIDAVARYKRLLVQDFISTDQFRQRQAEQLDQQSKLLGLQRDRINVSRMLRQTSDEVSSMAIRQENQLSRISRSVMDVDQMLVESEARRELAITAAETGTATAVIAEPGQKVEPARPVASIVPDGARWQIHLFVPSTAVGFLQIGDSVRVRYQAYPYQKFGQYRARVTSIARAALSARDLSESGFAMASRVDPEGSAFYRVTAMPEDQTVLVYGKPRSLQAGMALQADIMQERRRLYEWVLEPLYSITGKI